MIYMFGKRSYLTMVVTVVILLAGIVAYASTLFQAVGFDTTVIDAGLVREGEPVRAKFRFQNHGWSTAGILNVASGCGVVASLVRGRKLAAGEDGEIEVSIDTSGHRDLLAGAVSVTLSDPFERTVSLTVRANVDQEFVVAHSIVDFGRVARETPAHREVTIRLNKTSYRVLSARVTDANFEAYVESAGTDGVATLVVGTKRDAQLGLRFGTIRISTSSPHMPQLIVPVRAVFAEQF